MKLTFREIHQSINDFDNTDINNFAVITGLNGSGKTHLLNAVNLGKIVVEGVDPSEIIFYNYNDFTIYNGDPTTDTFIQQKHTFFSNKLNSFNLRLQNQRQNALNSFQLVQQVENIVLYEHFILQNGDFDRLTNWSEDDYIFYEQQVKQIYGLNPEGLITTLKPHQSELFYNIGYLGAIEDIRSFLLKLRQYKDKVVVLQFIRSGGYSRQMLNWENEELLDFFPIFAEASDKYMLFDGMHVLGNSKKISNSLNLFMQLAMSMTGGYNSTFTLDKLLTWKQSALILFEEIERHFIQVLDPETLNIIRGANGNNILDPISPVSGFLNLHEIKQAEKNYQIQKKQNEYAEFEQSKGKPAHYLNDEEFLKQYGESPIDGLNKVLNEYDCNGYEFRQSEIYYSWGMDVMAQDISVGLFNKTGNYQTNLDSLSSGERTLLALAFTVHKLKGRKLIAKLFLMDEVDSALHPSMSKRLLNVLYQLFHREMNINMIISTHSPSTVAFAPEGSTYIMRRDDRPRLIPASIDHALRELTAGVPSFSVNYENRRQVFVESKYDAEYYESLYNIFKINLNPDISLNFISSGDSETNSNGIGKANCDQVVKITGLLRSSGNKFIWGIIDWDLKSYIAQDGVKVLGEGSRYSIENYLLDPLLIAILLWREKLVLASFFGYSDETKFYQVEGFGMAELQSFIDKILELVEPHVKKSISGQQSYQTIGGVTLSLPLWFTQHQGHKLEEKLLTAFPRLNELKRNKEYGLKQAVISRVISDFPQLAPSDLVDILKQVQEI